MRLRDRTAIVTGADSGIGQAIAIEFAKAGADIAILFHTDQAGAEETRRCVEAAGRCAVLVQGDAAEEDCIARLFEETEAELGEPDILVNNTGTGQSSTHLADLDPVEFDRILRAELRGPFLCCRAFIRCRRNLGGHGRIINIASAHEAAPCHGTARGGLVGLTRSLCLELAPDRINVNAIAPGLIHPSMTKARVVAGRQPPHIPWGRPGYPDEVAKMALYLASDEADYVTGQSFTIDGGLEMRWGQGT